MDTKELEPTQVDSPEEEVQEKLMTYSQAKEEIKKELAQELTANVTAMVKQNIQRAFLIDDRFAPPKKEEARRKDSNEEKSNEAPVDNEKIKTMVKDALKTLL